MSGNLSGIITSNLPDMIGKHSKGEAGSAKDRTGSARADNSQKEKSF